MSRVFPFRIALCEGNIDSYADEHDDSVQICRVLPALEAHR